MEMEEIEGDRGDGGTLRETEGDRESRRGMKGDGKRLRETQGGIGRQGGILIKTLKKS